MSLRARGDARPQPPDAGVLEGTELGERLHAVLARLPGLDVRSWRDAVGHVRLSEMGDHLRFAREGYTRTLLAATDEAEALLMGWLPGQASTVHDHGASRGMTLVLAGSPTEHTFELRHGRPAPRTTRAWRLGDTLYEAPGDVHQLVNAGPELLVTFHVFAPRLTEFRTYEV